MSKIVMYYHGGSANHGCEAIVRSTKKILTASEYLYTSNINEDEKYGLSKVINLQQDVEKRLEKNSIDFFKAAISHKIFCNDYKFIELMHRDFFDKIHKNDIYLSIGGDNYCYKGRDILGYYNKIIHKKGGKTVLWGCSFEPKDMTDEIAKDIKKYDLIVARENISYRVLKNINSRTVLLPDPAFQLDKKELPLPEGFIEDNTIGINLSPLIAEYADENLIVQNYKRLIQYIIDTTYYNIAFIPHVVKEKNDDRVILMKLYQEFKNFNRAVLIEDCNCEELKGYIARCRMFIGARTHATIAAYSTCVPTLVVGYSVKAIGIARELFDTDENYVIPVQKFESDDDLVKAFRWLQNKESEIRVYLKNMMPEYKNRILQARELIERL